MTEEEEILNALQEEPEEPEPPVITTSGGITLRPLTGRV